MLVRTLIVVGVAIGGTALFGGLDYYVLPVDQRPFSALHDLYAPTGLVGQGLGIVGTAMIAVGVGMYSLRKRARFLSRVGTLKTWLQIHIFLCLLGPFLVLLHTTFKFGGVVAISFWSMALVVGSGVFGRWVYVWIPKTMNGRFLGAEEIRGQMAQLLTENEGEVSLSSEELAELVRPAMGRAGVGTRRMAPPSADRRSASRETPDRRRRARRVYGIGGALTASLQHRIHRRRNRRRFDSALTSAGVQEPIRSRLVRRLEQEVRIEHQLLVLEPFRRAFRYWHAFHLPLAVVMLVILIVHIGVSIAFGYTWVFSA